MVSVSVVGRMTRPRRSYYQPVGQRDGAAGWREGWAGPQTETGLVILAAGLAGREESDNFHQFS